MVFLSNFHDEYWSMQMRNNVTAGAIRGRASRSSTRTTCTGRFDSRGRPPRVSRTARSSATRTRRSIRWREQPRADDRARARCSRQPAGERAARRDVRERLERLEHPLSVGRAELVVVGLSRHRTEGRRLDPGCWSVTSTTRCGTTARHPSTLTVLSQSPVTVNGAAIDRQRRDLPAVERSVGVRRRDEFLAVEAGRHRLSPRPGPTPESNG